MEGELLSVEVRANALHHATRARRNERPIDPYFWASHIHVGA